MHERVFDALRQAEKLRNNENLLNALSDYERQTVDLAIAALNNSDRLGWNLLETPSRLNISTIDGFCKALCNHMPFSSGMGSNSGITELPQLEGSF